jgi:2-polyprenyl-3-methyl-5-hydroxy-6-metoxy-1,4-benzoquinol methylase
MKVKQKVWESAEYLTFAKKGSMDREHPGMKKLFEHAEAARKILDFGCGEGTRLNLLFSKGKKLYGIDISKNAIKKAKKKYSKIKFFHGSIGSYSLDSDFDLIYSAFVLEHTRKTESILKELIKRLKVGGVLILMAPNYGAPNRASPVAKYNRTLKLVMGFIKDIIRIIKKGNNLDWKRVEPLDSVDYKMDLDTTIEPYLGTLVNYLMFNKMKIKETDSVWERELKPARIHQNFFRFLGEKRIYPFKYWGPHLLVVAEKL